MTKTTRSALFLALLSAVALGQQQPAGPSAADAIKARQGLMQLQKFALSTVSSAVKDGGNVTDAAVQAAQNLASTADLLPAAFTIVKDSGLDKHTGQTRAKPEIWKNESEVNQMVMAFQSGAQKLAAAAKSKDANAVREQVKAVGGECNNCHKKFRAEK